MSRFFAFLVFIVYIAFIVCVFVCCRYGVINDDDDDRIAQESILAEFRTA